MKTALRALRWFLINGLFAALMWFGFGEPQIDGARWVFTFFLWFSLFVQAVVAFHKETATKVKAKGSPVPAWLLAVYDILQASFLVWHGSWVLGLVVIVQMLLLLSIYGEDGAERLPAIDPSLIPEKEANHAQ